MGALLDRTARPGRVITTAVAVMAASVAALALLVLGMKKRKAAPREESAWVPAPLLLRDGAGIGVWGRF